jgi:hypothetical protein
MRVKPKWRKAHKKYKKTTLIKKKKNHKKKENVEEIEVIL